MLLEDNKYKKRLIDNKIEKYLKVFGAISITGPKWCGKTSTALYFADSVSYLTDKSVRDVASVKPSYIFTDTKTQLIDEWQLVPGIWDAVRHRCDRINEKGKFILTGSTSLEKDEEEEEVFHSGTGRIASINMFPMSLYESGDSSGKASITDMLNDSISEGFDREIELDYIAKLIIRGGWPENINIDDEFTHLIPREYIESVINKDINERKTNKKDPNKVRMLLKSLARNTASVVGVATIVKDIEEYENQNDLLASRQTVSDYLSSLNNLYLIFNQEAFSINYRSSKRVGKTSKKHLVDPSLACACLDLSVPKLMDDFNTFGLMFESLVIRDLRIYVDYLDGRIYHFRDNQSGDEVDAILEFRDGSYGVFEVKLTSNGIDDAKKSLLKFYDNVSKKPKFMCIIVGVLSAVMKDEETGIYIVPITSLRP